MLRCGTLFCLQNSAAGVLFSNFHITSCVYSPFLSHLSADSVFFIWLYSVSFVLCQSLAYVFLLLIFHVYRVTDALLSHVVERYRPFINSVNLRRCDILSNNAIAELGEVLFQNTLFLFFSFSFCLLDSTHIYLNSVETFKISTFPTALAFAYVLFCVFCCLFFFVFLTMTNRTLRSRR